MLTFWYIFVKSAPSKKGRFSLKNGDDHLTILNNQTNSFLNQFVSDISINGS